MAPRTISAVEEETIDSVQEKLWRALPSVVKICAERVAAAEVAANTDGEYGGDKSLGKDTVENPNLYGTLRDLLVPFSDIRHLAECLFMACHTNPVESDIENGLVALLGRPDEKEGSFYTFNDFVQVLRDVESNWLDWHDSELKWRAVSEKQHMSVVKELLECVTQDVEPFALLPRQEVLTALSVVAHTKTLITPFECFVEFVEPREFPEIYDTLWDLLQNNDEGEKCDCDILTVEQFTVFFKWFYLHFFSNATEDSAVVAARKMWFEYLSAKGVFTKKNFVTACRRMCQIYGTGNDDVKCLETLFRSTQSALLNCEGNIAAGSAFFKQRGTYQFCRILSNPMDIYVPEELDEAKVEMESLAMATNVNCIIIYGKRGVGKTTLAKALARRLNCVYLDIADLALEAVVKMEKGEEDLLGAQLVDYVRRDTSVPLSLLAALVRRKLCADETMYRGYVFSNIPIVHDMKDINLQEFLKGCGILDVMVPNFFLHIRCDDTFYSERSAAALEERCALRQMERQLREAVEQERALEESRRKALVDKVEHLRETVRQYKELLEAAATKTDQGDAEQAEMLEAARVAAENAEIELPNAIEMQKSDEDNSPKVSTESVERAEQIRKLTVQRIISQSLAGEENWGNEVSVNNIPLFQEIFERARFLDHCLTIGCTSLVEDAVEYVVNTLQLQTCVLPRDLALLYKQEQGEISVPISVENDMEIARKIEEMALSEMGALNSTRWKQFCPVTFTESGVLIEGTARYGCIFRQRLYYLASEKKLSKFVANPLPYLSKFPVDRQPIFMFSTIRKEDAVNCLPPKVLSELMQFLHEQLRLTLVGFNQFVNSWGKCRKLREQRDESLAARRKFEAIERKLRADRLKKRKAKELKKKRKKQVPTPPPKGRKRSKSSTSSKAAVEENIDEGPFKGWEKTVQEPETVTSHIENVISEHLKRQKTFVPVLVHAFEDIDIEAFDQLLREEVLPENVVVLEYEQSLNDEDKNTALQLAEGDDDGIDEQESSNIKKTLQEVMLEKFEAKSRDNATARLSSDVSSPLQAFNIYRVTTNGKSARVLCTEILQSVCPGMAPVQDGVVDETLGELDEEEEEMDFYQDESEEERVDGPLAENVNPAIRPGKKFLDQFGSRLQYCPVTLYEQNLIMRGRFELCAQYQHRLYVFASEEAKSKFERNPLRYLDVTPPNVPLRLWIVGQSKSGKKTLAKALSELYNVPYFVYDRRFFERCIEAARKPGGDVIEGVHIPEHIGNNGTCLSLAEALLKELRDFAAEQERCIKLREEAIAEMARREEAEEKDEEMESDEIDEEAEARLQEYLEFESEAEEDRDNRITSSYLKLASYITRIEPFNSQGYIMVSPPFSDGDIELMFSNGAIPEAVVQIELSEDIYYAKNRPFVKARFALELKEELPEAQISSSEAPRKLMEKKNKQKERELRKWRRRHIGINDPESDPEDDIEEESAHEEKENFMNSDEDAIVLEGLVADRNLELEALAEFSEAVNERFIEPIVVNGDLSINAVFRFVTRRLCKALDYRRSFFYVPEIVRYDNAIKLLESGVAVLSYFGYTDSVALYDELTGVRRLCKWMPDKAALETEQLVEASVATNTEILNDANDNSDTKVMSEGEDKLFEEEAPQSRAGSISFLDGMEDEEMSEYGTEEMDEIIETHRRKKRREWLRQCQRVAHFCGRLFFFDTDASLFRFFQNPLLFVQRPPPLPRPPRMAVISVYEDVSSFSVNDDGIKRYCMANNIAMNLDFIFVSVSKLLTWAAVHAPLLSLSQRAINAVLTGTVDDALIAELLVHRLDAADARQKGVVLLNLPRTQEQYNLLLKMGLWIDKVFSFAENIYTDLRDLMMSTATVDNINFSTAPNSFAALQETTDYVRLFVRNEGLAALSRAMGFPMAIKNNYHTEECIAANISSYKWFCPSSWILHNNLVDMRRNHSCGAVYLGKYYFFSSETFLQSFILNPGNVTMPPGLKLLPTAIPSRVMPGKEGLLELLGCCPVTLYDTRENKGLRGVPEPVARKGDLACIVEYDGRYYALLDEEALERFMMCPWQYIEGAKLPDCHKVPLPADQTLESIDEETYMRRLLYDSVAYALIAVADARPMYPGLSLEESALKFIALHMKSFNPKNTAIQAKHYKDNYSIFRRRAMLYKTMTNVSEIGAYGDDFLNLCQDWEEVNAETTGELLSMSHV